MNEGELDPFVSSVSGTIPSTNPTGLWFSPPYFHEEGVGAIIQKSEVAERLWYQFRKQNGKLDALGPSWKALPD